MGLAAALTGLALALAGCGSGMTDNPADWHIDPLTAERTGKPNDYLVAPEGAASAEIDAPSPVFETSPEDLMQRFDAALMAEPRTTRLAGSVEAGFATYVQRSRIFGFPDYISAKALSVPDGAVLAIWSRARYGYGDMGVNEARVKRLLEALSAP